MTGDCIDQVNAQQMMENDDAWNGLVTILDTHQQDFNEQLRRLKAQDLDTDPNSPLLGPMKQYSESVHYNRLLLQNKQKLTRFSQNAGGITRCHHAKGWAGRQEWGRMEESERLLLKIRQRQLRAGSSSGLRWSTVGCHE
jgi:hypothetical protein